MRRVFWTCAIASLFVALATLGLPAQSSGPAQAPADAEFARKAYDTYRSQLASSPYRTLNWQYLGPTNISGRATDVAVADRGTARRIYAAYATSGVWKTDDNGATWQAVFEHQASTSIGDIAVASSNPDILWVGTGESNLFRASMPGVGVFKSIDAGRSFQHVGLTDTQTVSRIVVHPTNPDIVYVASGGHGWTDNEMRGVFKTNNGGGSWSKVLYRSPRTGAIDLVMDPSDPEVLYAAAWQRVRRKWSDPRVEAGYSETGIWKTTDGGRTWVASSQGLPESRFLGRIGLDVSRSNPNVLYALLDNYEEGRPPRDGERDAYGRPIVESRIKAAEVYRTDDKGRSWRKVSANDDFMTQHSGTYGWVFGPIRVEPSDENTIYTLGLSLNVSRDAGKSFTVLRGMHTDHHGLWIDPKAPAVLLNANDGGFYSSADAGKTWRFAVSAGGAQFYNVALDTSTPAWAYGSIQDIGSKRGQVNLSRGRDRIPAVEWTDAPGGEGSHQAIDSTDPNLVYSHGFYGNFTREDLATSLAPATPGQPAGRDARRGVTSIRPPQPAGEAELRAQWMAPIIVSAHAAATIYAGYQLVLRSLDRGTTWQPISRDLTANDPSRMLLKSSSAIPYQTIVALAESPRAKGLIYAGTDDGRLHVTQDGAATWTDLTANLPTRRWISRAVPSMHDEAVVYITQRGREDDDFGVYVYKSTDFGRTFTSIAANVPSGSVNVIREDPATATRLFLGTDFGAFVSVDGGRQWRVLGGNLPSVQVSDFQYHARDRVIVISTYGRGMWGMDADSIK